MSKNMTTALKKKPSLLNILNIYCLNLKQNLEKKNKLI